MPIRLDIKRKFTQRTDRVKGVELHPTEPWLLANLYNGNIYIWNHSDQSLVKSFEVTELPVRCSKFVPRKQWVVVGSDDMFVRVYNYNTMDRVKTWEAHTDYIRSLAVHPTLPYLLSSSDDMLIKLWDWDQSWQCMQIFEGHVHYVMQIAFNPKDTNTFASASLDRTIKVWSLGQPTPNFTLEGHEKGVNCVDYFQGGERPHLISGADDRTVKVWDYQTKACVQTLEGHGHNISAACFHPELPLIMTGSEDGTVRVWHSKTYRLETTLNYGMERVWALGVTKGSNMIAIGCDEGVALAKLGREEPVASMDGSGKIIWAKHNEIQTANIKSLGPDYEMCDGERLPLPAKDLGSCELYPQKLQHNPNGRFVAVCGDGEYIVYTALAWRNKCYGSALEFVWGADPSSYAIRQSTSSISIFHSFQEKHQLAPSFSAEGIFGGQVLGVKGQDMIVFYDWTGRHIVRRIDVPVSDVLWSDSGDLLTIVSDGSFYILRYHASVVEQHLASGAAIDEDGIEDAFELINEIGEKVLTGLWVGDCFIYTNAAWRLNYCVGNEITTLYHLDRHVYLLGYLAAQNRIYLIDKEFGVVSYTLLLNLIEYKTLVMRDQMEEADAILPTLPRDQMNSVARFLESKGHVEKALEVAVDPDYRFELAVQLRHLEVAQEIAAEVDSASKWKQLGELALVKGRIGIATGCLQKAGDLSGLLLIHSSTGDAAGMKALIPMALAVGKHNIAFVASLLLGQVDDCIDLLVSNGRASEAAFFARTYAPSRVSETVKAWQEDLRAINPKAAESLADPAEYPNMFPAIDEAMRADAFARRTREHVIPASHFLDHKDDTAVDLISLLREAAAGANGPDPGASDDYVQVDSALAEAGPDGDVAEETEEDYGMPELTGDSLGGEEGAADSLLQQDDVDEDLAWADSADADDGDVEELV